jgi:hypothetical protein
MKRIDVHVERYLDDWMLRWQSRWWLDKEWREHKSKALATFSNQQIRGYWVPWLASYQLLAFGVTYVLAYDREWEVGGKDWPR